MSGFLRTSGDTFSVIARNLCAVLGLPAVVVVIKVLTVDDGSMADVPPGLILIGVSGRGYGFTDEMVNRGCSPAIELLW